MSMEWLIECMPQYRIMLEFDNINEKGNVEVHAHDSQEKIICEFCGKPADKWKKKDIAHAVSECLGNKKLVNNCECYECNHLFGEIAENHLGKFVLPYRMINEVYGKGKAKNVSKDMPLDKRISYGTYRFEQKKNSAIFDSEIFDVRNMLIEKNGAGRLTKSENGYILSIPRQKYQPEKVYASLLKIAYSLLPFSEIGDYIKGVVSLRWGLSGDTIVNENDNVIPNPFTADQRSEYLKGLPNIGWEVTLCDPSYSKELSVCLLKKSAEVEFEPGLLLAIQMGYQTIIIPVLRDNYISGEKCKIQFLLKDQMEMRELDFHKFEEEYSVKFTADEIEIPKELYGELTDSLRKAGLLL